MHVYATWRLCGCDAATGNVDWWTIAVWYRVVLAIPGRPKVPGLSFVARLFWSYALGR